MEEIRRHPWVVEGMKNQELDEWLTNTKCQSITVTDEDVFDAVTVFVCLLLVN
jgi:hypothetical protein